MAITLDSIREAADRKFASYDIDLGSGQVVKLRNPLRLGKAEREAFLGLQEELEAVGGDIDGQLELLKKIITLTADPKAAPAGTLLAALGDDAALITEVVNGYMEAQSVGEASTSES